jgi:hypothetical protein
MLELAIAPAAFSSSKANLITQRPRIDPSIRPSFVMRAVKEFKFNHSLDSFGVGIFPSIAGPSPKSAVVLVI